MASPSPHRRRATAGLAAVAVLVALVAGCSSDPPQAGATTPSDPGLARLTGGPVLAVKIDDTPASRPRVGVAHADVVYVEPVEAGLTRLLAVFSSSMPAQVGPVRSGRESDVDLLANYGPVAFAFSGGSPYTLGVLAQGGQVDVSMDTSGQGYHRASNRRAPYNVIGDTAALLARARGSAPPGDPGFRFGPRSPGGASGISVSTSWPGSRVALAWDPGRKRYLVATDGIPDVDADGTRVGAATVVVQQVAISLTPNRDVNGVQTPVAAVVGQGAFTVLRDGRAWAGQWSRPTPTAPTDYSAGGRTIAMASGPVWVLLVPQGQAVAVG